MQILLERTTKMKIRNIISLLTAISLCVSFCSCGSEKNPDSKSGTGAETSVRRETTDAYYANTPDLCGYTLKILSPNETFNCYVKVDFDEQHGEKLDDAVYERNRKVENKLNCTIKEIQADATGEGWGTGQKNLAKIITNMVLANETEYDAAYLSVFFQPSLITESILLDLKAVPELQLGEKWWDNAINDDVTINGHLFTASGPLEFMSFDMSWVLLFNEKVLADNGLEKPYDTVREGKWTLDRLNEMISGVASLNGDDSAKWNPDGNALYGIASHDHSPDAFLFSAGNKLMENEGGALKFSADTERMFSTIDKLSVILDQTNGNNYREANYIPAERQGYLYAFSKNRALFTTCELKSTLELRSMEANYGLVPMPKYDENQEKYITYVNPISYLLTIPKTNPDTKSTGIVIDALTYESYKDCLPVYYDYMISQKGLRDENSIEMLEIVRESRSTLLSNLFGITSGLSTELQNIIMDRAGRAASRIKALKSSIQKQSAKIMSSIE